MPTDMNRQRAIRALALAVALCGVGARTARAQATGAGRLDGTVTDSVHGLPLRGVRVQALGVESPEQMRGAATTDSAGRFRIDSLQPGRYMVGFESPLLDSLEIAPPPRAVTVEAGRSAMVDLAMPSAATLRAALCPGVPLGADAGVVYGHVVDAETESPLADAAVALQWRELAVWDKAGSDVLRPVRADKLASATTDARGWYRACGVPTGTWLSMQIQQNGRVGPVLRAVVDSALGIAIRHISFSAVTAHDSGAFVASAPVAPFTGTATLAGVVRGPGGNPIPSVEVHVSGTRGTAVTDAEGHYTLSGLPAGTHELEARRIGYSVADAWVELRNGATMRGDVRIERIVSLDSVRVVATRTRYREFSEHQKMALNGRFIGPERLQRLHFSRTSDLIRSLGGFVIENRGGRTRVGIAGQGASARPCYANVVIDGLSGWDDDPDAVSVDDVPPNLVGAVELHSGTGPPEYGLGHGCGTIVIWTKR